MPCSRLEERDPARPKDELGTLRLANADPPVLGEQPCFALPCDQGAPSGAGYGRLRVLALPCARSGGCRRPGTAPRPPLLCLCSTYPPYVMEAARLLNEGMLPPERAGGRRPKFALYYTTAAHTSHHHHHVQEGLRQVRARSSPLALRGSSLQRLLGLAPRG